MIQVINIIMICLVNIIINIVLTKLYRANHFNKFSEKVDIACDYLVSLIYKIHAKEISISKK